MSKKYYPTDLVNFFQRIRAAWTQIDSDLKIGNLTHATMGLKIEQARMLDEELDKLQTAILDKRNQRDALYASLWEDSKRVRSMIKGIYGDDSSQCEMVGGTRSSERKTPTRKPAA